MSNPKVIGFRPSPEEVKMLADLQQKFNSHNPFGKITNSDVLKFALKELHEKYLGEQS